MPIGHSTTLKEKYAIKTVLQHIKYEHHQWVICVNLKMVNFLLGQQSGYTKFPCFLCYWDSRDKANHWKIKNWPVRELKLGNKTLIHDQLVSHSQIGKLIKYPNFQHSMNKIELASWLSFVEVVQSFLGSRKADNYKDIVQKLLGNFQALDINMSIKVSFTGI